MCVFLYTYICTYIDVDGTLTAPRKVVTPEMRQFMADLRKKVNEGLVNFVVSYLSLSEFACVCACVGVCVFLACECVYSDLLHALSRTPIFSHSFFNFAMNLR